MTMNDEKEQPVAIEAKKPERQSKYVTTEKFNEKIDVISGYLEALATDSSQRKAELDTITNISQRVAGLEDNQAKMINILQQAQQQPAQQQQQQQHKQSFDITGSAEALKALAEAGRSIKDAFEGNQNGDDRLLGVLKTGLAREQNKYVMRLVRGMQKKGSVLEEEIHEAIASGIDTGESHKPIL